MTGFASLAQFGPAYVKQDPIAGPTPTNDYQSYNYQRAEISYTVLSVMLISALIGTGLIVFIAVFIPSVLKNKKLESAQNSIIKDDSNTQHIS